MTERNAALSADQQAEIGAALYRALRSQRPVPPLSQRYPEMSITDAYQISRAMLAHRIDADGERLVGKKIGVTSKVVQDMLGVHQPDFGFLTDAMWVDDGADVAIAGNLIQPRAEAEIAFKLKRDLRGPGIREADVLAATEAIMPCFEIVDSRICDWAIKIQDTIADNASCGVFALGADQVDPAGLDLAALKISMWCNDVLVSEGEGSAVQGNPLTAVAWLANTLGELGIPFLAGEIILSGSLVPLLPVSAGDRLRLELHGIGGASLRFV